MIFIDPYYIITPLSGALIGYITNWVAIKMLFRPHTEKYAFGVRLPFTPGLIPKRRGILSRKVGETICAHLLTDEALAASMCSEDVKRNVESLIDGLLHEAGKSDMTIGGILARSEADFKLSGNIGGLSRWLADTLESEFFAENLKPLIMGIIERNIKGLASLFVSPESIYSNLLQSLSEYLRNPENNAAFEERLLTLWGKISEAVKIKDLSSKIEGERANALKALLMSKYESAVRSWIPTVFEALNLAGVIEERINGFDMPEAEEIIISVVDRELRAITYLGGFLGFIIGLVPPIMQSMGAGR